MCGRHRSNGTFRPSFHSSAGSEGQTKRRKQKNRITVESVTNLNINPNVFQLEKSGVLFHSDFSLDKYVRKMFEDYLLGNKMPHPVNPGGLRKNHRATTRTKKTETDASPKLFGKDNKKQISTDFLIFKISRKKNWSKNKIAKDNFKENKIISS